MSDQPTSQERTARRSRAGLDLPTIDEIYGRRRCFYSHGDAACTSPPELPNHPAAFGPYALSSVPRYTALNGVAAAPHGDPTDGFSASSHSSFPPVLGQYSHQNQNHDIYTQGPGGGALAGWGSLPALGYQHSQFQHSVNDPLAFGESPHHASLSAPFIPSTQAISSKPPVDPTILSSRTTTRSHLPGANRPDMFGLTATHEEVMNSSFLYDPGYGEIARSASASPDPQAPAAAGDVDPKADEDEDLNAEPYAQLIYRALKSVPEHRMVLRDIYAWFVENTDKAKNNSSKGWQNSIRHNLSMNGAFRKVEKLPSSDEEKRCFVWVLDPSALENGGVESTTRYRKSLPKKVVRASAPSHQRPRPGAKGGSGRASRRSPKVKQEARLEEPHDYGLLYEARPERKHAPMPYYEDRPLHVADLGAHAEPGAAVHEDESSDFNPFDLTELICQRDDSSSTPQSSIPEMDPYGFHQFMGGAPLFGHEPFFLDSYEPTPLDPLLSNHHYCGSENHLGCPFGRGYAA